MANTHQHFYGFVLNEDALRAHLELDHELSDQDVAKLTDPVAKHNEFHPEITTPPS